jgi:DNA-binding transcriptional MocR family regulator
MDKAIRLQTPHALGVAPSEGEWRLRTQIARRFGAKADQVLIVSGAQQGLDLVGRCLLDPGDAVIIDRPGYVGAIQNFRAAGARLVGWDFVRADLNELEDLILRYRPKLICTNPTFQNPTGRSLSLKERRELLELTSRYRVPLVEDDPSRDTSLSGPVPPSLFELDAANNTVIFLGSFSKTLAPGLRLGWVLASEYIVEQLASIKERQILFTGGLNQMVLAEFLENGTYEDHLTRLKDEHRKRLNVMIRSLRRYFSAASLAINAPVGGLHVWCQLSGEVEIRQLARHAMSRGVVLANGEMFYPDNGAGGRQFRLCFTSMSAAKIEEGVKSLSDAFIAAKSESSGIKRSRVSIV